MLKQTFAIATLGAIFAGSSISAVNAAPQDFVGTWVNTNPNTNGITRLVVTQAGGGLCNGNQYE